MRDFKMRGKMINELTRPEPTTPSCCSDVQAQLALGPRAFCSLLHLDNRPIGRVPRTSLGQLRDGTIRGNRRIGWARTLEPDGTPYTTACTVQTCQPAFSCDFKHESLKDLDRAD